MEKFKVGDIVRIAPKWRNSEAEGRYIYKVLETGLWGPKEDRIKIGCLNSSLVFGSTEVVDPEMIELYYREEAI